jgi:hypothetical protein
MQPFYRTLVLALAGSLAGSQAAYVAYGTPVRKATVLAELGLEFILKDGFKQPLGTPAEVHDSIKRVIPDVEERLLAAGWTDPEYHAFFRKAVGKRKGVDY